MAYYIRQDILENIWMMQRVIKERKRINVVILIGINVLFAILICVYVLQERGFHEIDSVYLKVLETKNEKSTGSQVRIRSIVDDSGCERDLREIARVNNWDYDEDLQCLAYYGTGNLFVELPVSHTDFLYISVLEQSSSGKIEMYRGEKVYKKIDLYNNDWNIRNYMIHGKRNLAVIFLVFLCAYIIVLFVLIPLERVLRLLKEGKKEIRKFVSCSLILFIECEIIAISLGLCSYPEREYKFVDDMYDDYSFTGFKIQNNELYSEINDPNVTIFFEERKIPVKQVSIYIERLPSWREWGQGFLLNEDYEAVEFFLQEGRNEAFFRGGTKFFDRPMGLRLDLASRPGVCIGVDTVVVNERSAIAKKAIWQGIIIYWIFMLTVIVLHVIRLGYMGKTLPLKRWVFFTNPIIVFLSVEFLELNPLILEMKIWIMAYVFILLCQMILYCLCKKMFLSIWIVDILMLFLGLVNFYVTIFRGTPLTIHDVYNATTAVNVMGEYEFKVFQREVLSILMNIGYIFVMQALVVLFRKKHNASQGIHPCINLKSRLCVGSVCVLAVYIFLQANLFGDIEFTMNIVELYQQNGFILSFFTSNSKIEKPKGYSVKRVNEILQEGEDEIEKKVKPNIIVIMNESLADLTDILQYDTNIEVLPFFNSLNENVVKGHCYVSVFGGGTSNTEFEMLTGNSLAFLPRGSNAYTQYCNRELDSLVSYLKSKGYLCVAEHPNTAANYNRDNVYRYMGFHYFLDESEFRDDETLRFVSDQATYNKIIELYEDDDRQKPFFMFDVTMQNHGGYGTVSNWQEPVKLLGEEFSEANEYLSSIHVSDKAFQGLVEYFAKKEEPTVILMFGDHQPSIGDGFVEYLTENSGKDELICNYVTPFIIWANYSIETKLDVEISSNYLSYLLLETAGAGQSKYTSFLGKMYQEIPVITVNNYIDKERKWHEWGEQSDYKDLLLEYQIVQYAHFHDRRYKYGFDQSFN